MRNSQIALDMLVQQDNMCASVGLASIVGAAVALAGANHEEDHRRAFHNTDTAVAVAETSWEDEDTLTKRDINTQQKLYGPVGVPSSS